MKRNAVVSNAIGAMADVLGCAYPANVNDAQSSLIITREDFENLALAHKELSAQYASGQLFDKGDGDND